MSRRRIRPLTLTRAIRRELAACVQQLITHSHRWPLQVRAQRHDHWVLHLQGWPEGVDICIGVQYLRLQVMYQNQCWDVLLWPDVSPTRLRGQWRCADCASIHGHACLRELLWQHLCEPLLAYLHKLPKNPCLCLYGGDWAGYTCAQVVSDDSPHRESLVACWPIMVR